MDKLLELREITKISLYEPQLILKTTDKEICLNDIINIVKPLAAILLAVLDEFEKIVNSTNLC